jgi:hypothetical protein
VDPLSHSPGTSAQPQDPAIKVTLTGEFKSAVVNGPQVTLTAIVQNDSSGKGVTWSLTANGQSCSPACGTLVPAPAPSFSANYTPPSSLPAGDPSKPTISAQSVADRTKFDKFSFKLLAATINLTISGAFQTATTAGPPVTLGAITNDPLGVTWALTANGTSCEPVCGTLVVAGGQHLAAIYTPPPILASQASPAAIITVTSISDPSKNASFSFAILAAATSNYTLLLRGYDPAGTPMAIAGILVADVNGNITGGELDINDGGNAVHAGPLQGKFGTDTNFEGIIRGTITITNFVFPGTSVNPAFKFVIRGNQLEARAIEFDATGNLNAGTILFQSGVSPDIPTGGYAFGVDSEAPSGRRTVAAGAFDIARDGSIAGVADESQAQAALPDQAEPLTGNATVPDALGRGTLSFSINGTTTQYAYYRVNAGQLTLIQIAEGLSSGTVLAGTARAHSFTFDSTNGVFQTSVFQLTGVEPQQGLNVPDVAIGVLAISDNTSIQLTGDMNDAGVVNLAQKFSAQLSSYDPNTGRGVASVTGGAQAGFADTLVFYLYDNGEGFVIEADPSINQGTTNRAFSGTFARQVPGPFSVRSIGGALIAVSGAASVPQIPNVEAAINVGPTFGSLTGMAYATSTQAGQLANVTFQGSYSVTDGNAGRGSMMLPAGFYGDFTSNALVPASFYLIGPGRFFSIGVQNGTISGISYFSPD